MATALVLAGLPSAALARTVDGGWQPIDVQTCGAAAPTCDTGMQPVAKFAPVGSTVDATNGARRLTVQNARDGRDAIDVSGGMFVFRQVAKGKQRGRTLLELRTAQPNLCAAPGATRLLQRLTARGGGAFVVRTRFSGSSATRPQWTTEDRCESTATKVSKGSVTVRNLATKKTVRVRAGRDHTARRLKR